jgi:hypothetical protein
MSLRLMLSLLIQPKVIQLSGEHCICKRDNEGLPGTRVEWKGREVDSTVCFINLDELNLLKISLPWSKSAVSNVKRTFVTNVATGTSLSPHLLKIHYDKYWQGIFFKISPD